jgi:lipopolysaccharide/colanic/teichoic acid biosynthesis glycosyltransferase
MKHLYRHLTINIFLALGVFYVSLLMHNGATVTELLLFGIPGIVYYGVHFIISLLGRKYYYDGMRSFTRIFSKFFTTWSISTGVCLLILVIFDIDWISRGLILINIFGLISGEAVMVMIISFFRESPALRDIREIIENGRIDVNLLYPPPKEEIQIADIKSEFILQLDSHHELAEFIQAYFVLSSGFCRVLNTDQSSDLLGMVPGKFYQIINIFRLDYLNRINTFLEAANSRLPLDGKLMVCSETMNLRKYRILQSRPHFLNRLFYLSDFIVMNLLPAIPIGRSLHRLLTGGKRRVISRPEILGRLSACGFEITDEKKINGLLYVVARKVTMPVSHVAQKYGLLIHLNRIGQHGKIIKVYKIRTMYPYSEYIQDYVYRNNQLDGNGKFKDDFRITSSGRFLRKYWIDELPSLWNWARGDMKLVGVRPLSKHYYNLYTPELQQKRIHFKPGLIPPFYVDLPKSLDEIMASENRYLDAYEKSPFLTDFRYFFKAMYNIVIKGVKSR